MTPLQKNRLEYLPKLPRILKDLNSLKIISKRCKQPSDKAKLKNLFTHTADQPIIEFKKGTESNNTAPLKVGVVLSGGQAPGGHNVIAGLYDALKKLNPKSTLVGFLDGPSGIIKNKSKIIDEKLLSQYRNQGGFDMIGSGRTKIESDEQFAAAESTVKALDLDGLVIIGGDDSNTTAVMLADYFLKKGVKTTVVGVPKTIDGDLRNKYVEIPFGFDTASKIYSEIIGNILKDSLSAKKYFFFIKLMGRSASHITLECALRTHPNMALIGEEVAHKNLSLSDLVKQIADMICLRAEHGKNYGVVLIPEGIIEFIPEFKQMLSELNALHAPTNSSSSSSPSPTIDQIVNKISDPAKQCFKSLPSAIQKQLLMERDPHGNVQVAKIETERLFIDMVEKELQERTVRGLFKGKFSAQPLFCGYEGRSGLPSNFDCKYTYALGHVAALLVNSKLTGYMSCVWNLTKPVNQWRIFGVPIYSMLHIESRAGKLIPVIEKAIVDLQSTSFEHFSKNRESWILEDDYSCPGPIQYEGPKEITEGHPLTI